MLKLALILLCFTTVMVPAAPQASQRRAARRNAVSDLDLGKRLFVGHCAHCHGIDGSGGRGPSLAQPRLKHASDDKALASVIRDGLDGKEMPGFWQMNDGEIRQLVAYVRSLGTVSRVALPGDAARGKALYSEKGGCSACHVVNGEGTGYGPELSAIGARRSPAYLKESLINPSASVPEGFLIVRAKTTDGA